MDLPALPAGNRAPLPANRVSQTAPSARTPAEIDAERQPPDLDRTVKRALQQSVAYQLVQRTLRGDQERSARPATEPAAAPAATTPRAAETVNRIPAADLERQVTRATAVQTRSLEVRSEATSTVRKQDPLMLDLDGDGLETTGVADGVLFDIDGDGRRERSSFATGDDALLALDRNGNGRIDDGRELFGDQRGDANGFAALAYLDADGNGRIDARDPLFSELLLVRADRHGRQVSTRLADTDITSIDLGHTDTRRMLNAYDEIAQVGRFTRSDGSSGLAADVLLGHQVV